MTRRHWSATAATLLALMLVAVARGGDSEGEGAEGEGSQAATGVVVDAMGFNGNVPGPEIA
jgi:hypothetical protein